MSAYPRALAESSLLLQVFDAAIDNGAEISDEQLAGQYGSQAWYALFAGEFAAAEIAARRGLELDPSAIWIAGNLAHALMFQDRLAEADALFEQHRGALVFGERPWEEVVEEDLGFLRAAGRDHLHMDSVLARWAD